MTSKPTKYVPTPDTNSDETTPASPSLQQNTREAITTILGFAAAVIAALVLIVFVFQSYQVSGDSMQNTLQSGDRMIVWKLPRTWAKITGHQYVPKRGDIVIVNQQNLSACDQAGKQIIKRVIGLPGDRVVYKNDKYTVYNSAHPSGYDPDTSLPYGKTGTPLLTDTQDLTVDVTLKANQLFIAGDHRADSCDSRFFGPITTNQIIGKLAVRILPFSHIERF